jgi:hypothetical protein
MDLREMHFCGDKAGIQVPVRNKNQLSIKHYNYVRIKKQGPTDWTCRQ